MLSNAIMQILINKGESNMENKATWELEAMVKALSLPISSFLNTDEDNKRLERAKQELKRRK